MENNNNNNGLLYIVAVARLMNMNNLKH